MIPSPPDLGTANYSRDSGWAVSAHRNISITSAHGDDSKTQRSLELIYYGFRGHDSVRRLIYFRREGTVSC